MYELVVDCGTCIDRYELETRESVKEYMQEFEVYYKGSTEELLSKGITNCGIDAITLEEIFETYDIKYESLLQHKESKGIEVVTSIQVDKYDGLEIRTQKLYYKRNGKEVEFCVDESHCSYHSVKSIYKDFYLVGEDFKLFTKEDK